jgi:biotin carboxyl carrier protein
MNEIKAEINGTVTQVCVKNGQAIEFGQVLFKVRVS